MNQLTTIELQRENMDFSVAHFTIFSATEREALHGHNYQVAIAITTVVEENGLSFDYRFYKKKVYELCKQLNQSLLLPEQSQYLTITEQGDYYEVLFNQEKMPFLKSDVTLLPLTNITVEELSQWFMSHLVADEQALQAHHIQGITVKVFSCPGQSGSASWQL